MIKDVASHIIQIHLYVVHKMSVRTFRYLSHQENLKRNSQEKILIGGKPNRKRLSLEENLTGRKPNMNTTSQEKKLHKEKENHKGKQEEDEVFSFND